MQFGWRRGLLFSLKWVLLLSRMLTCTEHLFWVKDCPLWPLALIRKALNQGLVIGGYSRHHEDDHSLWFWESRLKSLKSDEEKYKTYKIANVFKSVNSQQTKVGDVIKSPCRKQQETIPLSLPRMTLAIWSGSAALELSLPPIIKNLHDVCHLTVIQQMLAKNDKIIIGTKSLVHSINEGRNKKIKAIGNR